VRVNIQKVNIMKPNQYRVKFYELHVGTMVVSAKTEDEALDKANEYIMGTEMTVHYLRTMDEMEVDLLEDE
jgi:hypothetical protein